MNLTESQKRRDLLLQRINAETDDTAPVDLTTPRLCRRCNKPRHRGRCALVIETEPTVESNLPTDAPVKKAVAKKSKAKTSKAPKAAPVAMAVVAPAPSTALVAQPVCTWAIKFDEGDDHVDMSGVGRERFEKVIQALHALIS